MLKKMTVSGFAAVPYLETSQLMQAHGGRLTFSTKKPNVIVGPNGAGKSAMMTALALRFLAYFIGRSAFDDRYIFGRYGSEEWFTPMSRWSRDYAYLQGLGCDTDNAPAVYYRPGHVPGNEDNVVTSMMVGYDELAKEYGRAVEDKSSGQGNGALLEKVLAVLTGDSPVAHYQHVNWRFGKELRDLDAKRGYAGESDYKAEALKKLVQPSAGAIPLVMMDEPEQSLDARAEAKLWKAVAAADCSKMQVIVATHSLFPLMHPRHFNIIEAEAGFVESVLELHDSLRP